MDTTIRGITLFNEKFDFVSTGEGWPSDFHSWVTKDVPVGKEVIGLKCSFDPECHHIKRLGFLLWTPYPE